MDCRYSIVIFIAVLSVFLSYSSADSQSFIVLNDYISPSYSYKIIHTPSQEDCINACRDDALCSVWTRDVTDGKCALKSDCDGLVQIAGVVSGVKHITAKNPVLKDNAIGAYLHVTKYTSPAAPAPEKPKPKVATATATASASSSGSEVSTASARSVATPDTVVTQTSATGNGRATASAENDYVSLQSATVAEDGKTARFASAYYKKVQYLATIPLVGNKRVHVISRAEQEPYTVVSTDYTCIQEKSNVYKNGKVIHEASTEDVLSCCLLCRITPKCISWWRNSDTKRCVLNEDHPTIVSNEKFYGGVFF